MRCLKHILKCTAVLGFAFALGCAAEPKKVVTLSTSPEGATLKINGQVRGKAPLTTTLDFAKNQNYEVVATLPDYEDAKAFVGLEPKSKTDYPLALAKKQRIVVKTVQIEPTPTEMGVELKAVEKTSVAYLETIERSAVVPGVTQLTFNTDPAEFVGPPTLSPVSDTMVYTVTTTRGKPETTSSNIWKQEVNSAARVRVTFGQWRDLDPVFSTDGQFLVFSSNRTGTRSSLWRVNAQGAGGIGRITNTDAADFGPSMSPGSDWIAFSSLPPLTNALPQIWMVHMNGSLPTQLHEGQQPQISPDGKQILFIRPVPEINKARGKPLGQLWLMSVDGSSETLLTSDITCDVKDPKWSPDGRWILFACDEGRDSAGANNYDIWIMAADGTQRKQLTTNGSCDDGPCMDRKQEFIYFRSNRGGRFNIWRFPTQNLGLQKATPTTLPVAVQ